MASAEIDVVKSKNQLTDFQKVTLLNDYSECCVSISSCLFGLRSNFFSLGRDLERISSKELYVLRASRTFLISPRRSLLFIALPLEILFPSIFRSRIQIVLILSTAVLRLCLAPGWLSFFPCPMTRTSAIPPGLFP